MISAGLVGALVALAAPMPALAAPVTMPVCDPAAATAQGDPTTVTIPDAAVFREGKAIAIQVNDGSVQDLAQPIAFGHVPICAVMPTEAGTPEPRPEWLFCLEREKYGCEEESGYTEIAGAAYTAQDRARLAWVFANARLDTPTSRAEAQALVWCVTDRIPANQVNAAAVDYYAARRITISGRCPDWPSIDPTLPLDPDARLTGPTEPVPVGGTARFRLDTTADPITVTATGGRVAVCPDSGNGTLTGDTLRLDPARPVHLCLTRTTPGPVSVSVERHGVASPDMEFWTYTADSSCQALLRQETAPSSLHATAGATFVPALPDTGTRSPLRWIAAVAACLALGTLLLLIGRIRTS